MANQGDSPETSTVKTQRTSREFWFVVGAMMLVATGLSWLGQFVPWFSEWGALLIALTFLYLPIEVLERQNAQLRDFGIWIGHRAKGIKNWLMVSLVVFPVYSIGFHFWQTNIEQRKTDFSIDKLIGTSWPIEFQNQKHRVLPPGIRMSMKGDELRFNWSIPAHKTIQIDLESDAVMTIRALTDGVHTSPAKTTFAASNTKEYLSFSGPNAGTIILNSETPQVILTVYADGHKLNKGMVMDSYHRALDENPVEVNQESSLWLLINFILAQLILIALPEEVFYRGYVQSRLEAKYPKKSVFLGVEISWRALIYSSAIFAVGHILTIPHPARLSVFFPSLLFGWMRCATGSVFSAILFHASCNIFAHLAFKFYV